MDNLNLVDARQYVLTRNGRPGAHAIIKIDRYYLDNIARLKVVAYLEQFKKIECYFNTPVNVDMNLTDFCMEVYQYTVDSLINQMIEMEMADEKK